MNRHVLVNNIKFILHFSRKMCYWACQRFIHSLFYFTVYITGDSKRGNLFKPPSNL